MDIIALLCPYCHGSDLSKFGKTRSGKERYACNNPQCPYYTFTLETHTYPGRRPEVKAQIVDMPVNWGGIRDTAIVLCVSTSTVIQELKQRSKAREYQSQSAGKT
jgi:transposase-like protein